MAYADLYTQYQSAMPQGGGFNPLETEEERRKRLAAEAAEAEPTPVKETRTIDPETGQVKLKIEGSEQDLSAANPLTPTVVPPRPPAPTFDFNRATGPAPVAPVAPPQMAPPPQPPMPPPQAQPVSQPVAAPVRPQPIPTAPPPPLNTMPGTYSDIPAGAPVITAGGMGTAPATAPNGAVLAGPVNPNQAVAQPPAPAVASPVPEGGTASTLGSVQNQPYVEQFFKGQNDSNALAQLRSDPNTPDWLKKIAAKQDYKQLKFQQETNDAQAKLKTDIENGDNRAIASAITKKKDDGNMALAWIFSLVGNQAAANYEVEKWKRARGIGSIWQPGQLGEDSVAIKVDPDGSVREGVFTSGANQGKSLSNKELVLTYGQGTPGGPGKALKADVGAMYEKLDDKGNVIARGIRSSKFVNGRTITGIESGGKFMPLDPGWRPESITTATTKSREVGKINLINSLLETHGKNQLNAERDLLAEAGPYGSPTNPFKSKEDFYEAYKFKERIPTEEMVTPAQSNIKPMSAPTGIDQGATMQTTGYQPGQDTGGFIQTGGPVTRDTPINEMKRRSELEKKAAETGIEVGGKRSESYNKHLDEKVTPDATTGNEIAQLRRRQFGLFNSPGVNVDKIFGLYNAAGDSPDAQKGTIIRDIFAGMVGKEKDEISARIAQLGLDPVTRSALEQYAITNAEINRRTLKATAGGGNVSDAEQAANKASNVDPTRIPALGGYNAMAQSQFGGDLASYKGDWAADQNFSNTTQLEKAWRKEQTKYIKMYQDIAEKRGKYIVQSGGNTSAVIEGYRRFPIPEYDAGEGRWKKTRPLSEILGR